MKMHMPVREDGGMGRRVSRILQPIINDAGYIIEYVTCILTFKDIVKDSRESTYNNREKIKVTRVEDRVDHEEERAGALTMRIPRGEGGDRHC